MMNLSAMAPAAPEIFLAVAGMAMMMIGVFSREGRALRLVNGLALVSLTIALVAVVLTNDQREVAFNGLFIADTFGAFMKILVLLGSIMTLIMSGGFIRREGMARFEYPLLIVFATVGMLLMISANDLIALYLGLELQNLALYVLAASQRDSVRSTEAGLKYFVLSALSSGLLLYGCSMIYGFAGTTQFEALAAIFLKGDVSIGLVVGLVFLLAGLVFKVSAVPFHMWTPDVYEGAPTPVTAFFSIAPKTAAVAMLLRTMLGPFGPVVGEWQQIIILISILSMVLGSFVAINQTNIKRMMAYSSIGHVGYALIGLAAGSESGLRGILIYMAIYIAMNAGTFGIILIMQRQGRMVERIDDLSGLAKTHPRLALAMLIFMFSMAGIPPLAGFFAKLYVFLAAIEAHLYTLAIIGVVTSVVAAYYYLRIVKVMYFDEVAESLDRSTDRGVTGVVAVTSILILLFFLWPALVIDGAAVAASALFPQ